MNKFLVTGGAGFIGSHLVDYLVGRGCFVRVLDDLSSGNRKNIASSDVELVVGSVCDEGTLARCLDGVDGCFHLAAIASVQRSVEEYSETHAINASAFVKLLDVNRRLGKVPVVYASSAAVYGDTQIMPLREVVAGAVLTPYAADKLSGELHARAAGIVFGIPTFGLRLFNVYGPRQALHSPYSGVISIFLEKVRSGQDITIFGDGLQERDFVHVHDVVRHLAVAMEKTSVSAPVVNVCTGKSSTILALAENIAGRSTRTRIIHASPRPGDILRSIGSVERAADLLGVRAEIGLEEGLRGM